MTDKRRKSFGDDIINDIAPGFHTINPDTRLNTQSSNNIPQNNKTNNIKIFNKLKTSFTNIGNNIREVVKKPTIFGTGCIIIHICLGNFAIFSLAPMAKSFGLVWIIIFCIIIGIINYIYIMKSFIASAKCAEKNYSDITEKFLGKKARRLLNIIIIIYSFLCMMYLISLTFPMIGRVTQILFYHNKYRSYINFENQKWGKSLIKYPFFLCIGFIVIIICVFKFIKLQHIGIFRIFAMSFCILILIIQCFSYYYHYKKNIYKIDDESTHPNWNNLGKAFTSKIDFFKGISILFASFTCEPVMFPIFDGFKIQEKALKKVQMGVLFGIISTTILTIISIVCSFLINPYIPEEFIFFRKNKNNNKDILMVIINIILFLCIIFTIPRYYVLLKIHLKFLLFKSQEKLKDITNYLIIFIFCFGSSFAAIFFNKLMSYLIYIGGFCSIFISYLFPAFIYAKSSGKNIKYWGNLLTIIFAGILCIIGIIGGIATLVDDIKN